MFHQLNVLNDKLFPMFHPYGERYCAGTKKTYSTKEFWDFGGASNLKELHFLINHYVMIRRLKKDVLDVPIKRREKIIVKIDENFENNLKRIVNDLKQSYQSQDSSKEDEELRKHSSVQSTLTLKLFNSTGIYKVKKSFFHYFFIFLFF